MTILSSSLGGGGDGYYPKMPTPLPTNTRPIATNNFMPIASLGLHSGLQQTNDYDNLTLPMQLFIAGSSVWSVTLNDINAITNATCNAQRWTACVYYDNVDEATWILVEDISPIQHTLVRISNTGVITNPGAGKFAAAATGFPSNVNYQGSYQLSRVTPGSGDFNLRYVTDYSVCTISSTTGLITTQSTVANELLTGQTRAPLGNQGITKASYRTADNTIGVSVYTYSTNAVDGTTNNVIGLMRGNYNMALSCRELPLWEMTSNDPNPYFWFWDGDVYLLGTQNTTSSVQQNYGSCHGIRWDRAEFDAWIALVCDEMGI